MTIGFKKGVVDISLLNLSNLDEIASTGSEQALIYDGTEYKKAEIASIASSEKSFTLVDEFEITASVSSIDVIGLDVYDEVFIQTGPLNQNANGSPYIKLSSDGGTSFVDVSYIRAYGNDAFYESGAGDQIIPNTFTGSGSSTTRIMSAKIDNFLDSYKRFMVWGSQHKSASFKGTCWGRAATEDKVNFVRIQLSGGNIRADLTPTYIQVFSRV